MRRHWKYWPILLTWTRMGSLIYLFFYDLKIFFLKWNKKIFFNIDSSLLMSSNRSRSFCAVRMYCSNALFVFSTPKALVWLALVILSVFFSYIYLFNEIKCYIIFFQDNFKEIISHTEINKTFPFDFNCDFIKMNFGADRQRQMTYQEFSQIIHVIFLWIFFLFDSFRISNASIFFIGLSWRACVAVI